jgi:hypothetical protein
MARLRLPLSLRCSALPSSVSPKVNSFSANGSSKGVENASASLPVGALSNGVANASLAGAAAVLSALRACGSGALADSGCNANGNDVMKLPEAAGAAPTSGDTGACKRAAPLMAGDDV